MKCDSGSKKKVLYTFDLKNSIASEELKIILPTIHQFIMSCFRANKARMEEELGPAAAYSAQVTINKMMITHFNLKT